LDLSDLIIRQNRRAVPVRLPDIKKLLLDEWRGCVILSNLLKFALEQLNMQEMAAATHLLPGNT